MKKIIFILFTLLSLNSYGSVFNIWYIENDTATTGQAFSVFVKCSYTGMNDTGRVYIKNIATSVFVEVYKVRIVDLVDFTTPTGPDDTYELIFTVPSGYTRNCEIFCNYTSMPSQFAYVRSNVPDLNIIGGFGAFSGNSGFSSQFKVSWTYQELITDSLELYLDGILFSKIALTDLEDDSIVYFVISGSPGVYSMTGNYVLNSGTWIDYTINTIAGIIDFTDTGITQKVKYYNIEGVEIIKPNEGFYIWRSANGNSGKVFIIN